MADGRYTAHEVAVILADVLAMIAPVIGTAMMNGCLICANCKRLVRIRVELLAGSNI